jgi:hypothetical protein
MQSRSMAAARVADGAKCLAGKKDSGAARKPEGREGPAGGSSPQALVLGRAPDRANAGHRLQCMVKLKLFRRGFFFPRCAAVGCRTGSRRSARGSSITSSPTSSPIFSARNPASSALRRLGAMRAAEPAALPNGRDRIILRRSVNLSAATTPLPLTQDMIRQLAFERGCSLSSLFAFPASELRADCPSYVDPPVAALKRAVPSDSRMNLHRLPVAHAPGRSVRGGAAAAARPALAHRPCDRSLPAPSRREGL